MIVHVTDLPLVERMWPTLEPMFAKVTCLTSGCYEPSDVLAEILSGKQQLWVSWNEKTADVEAAMTTMFDQYPRRLSCKVVFIAGKNMRSWLPEFRSTIENYARKNKATLLEGFFREGWVRMWPGTRTTGVGLVKEL